MTSYLSLNEKIFFASKSLALKILAIIAPVLLIFALFLTISTNISQYRHSILSSKTVIAQSISLGDFVFIRQFVMSLASDKSISFVGIKNASSGKWRLASDIDGRDERKALSSFQLRSYGVAFPIAIPLDGEAKFIFYLEYIFYFHQLLLPLLIAIALSIFIYFLQRRLLSDISNELARPVKSLASDIVEISNQSISRMEFTKYRQEPKFLEIELLATELKNQMHTINAQNEKMKEIEILESIRRFSKQVAHDIRSPLGALKVVSVKYLSDPEKSQSLLNRSVARIESIIDDLNKDSDAVSIKAQEKVFDLKSTVENLIREKKFEFSSISFSIELSLTGEEWNIWGNQSLISRTLSNLINNSLEACETTPQIEITLTEGVTSVILEISDNGKGILPEDVSNIFSYGFTKGKENGSGTGLWYAKKVVESIGGSIEVNSKPEVGTLVRLSFPRKAK